MKLVLITESLPMGKMTMNANLLFKKFDVLIESIMSICKGLYLAFLFVSQPIIALP